MKVLNTNPKKVTAWKNSNQERAKLVSGAEIGRVEEAT